MGDCFRVSGAEELADGRLCLRLDLAIYPLETVFRACYVFTDRCYLFLRPAVTAPQIDIFFSEKKPCSDLGRIVGDFCNELVDQRVRLDVAAETRSIRELIVAQAFVEANLVGDHQVEADYNDDPKGICR